MKAPMTAASHPALDRIRTLQGYLREDPANLPLQRELVAQYLAAGQPAQAVQQAESALALAPADTAMQATLAQCLLAAGQPQAALDRCAAWLGSDPTLVLIRQLQAAFATVDAEVALGDLLLQLFDASPWPGVAERLTVLRGLHFLQRRTEARQRADTWLAEMQDAAASVQLSGVAALLAFDDGDWQRARDLLYSAWDPSTDNVDLLYLGGSFALAAADLDTADALARRAVTHSPDDGRCWSLLGQVQLRQQHFAAAQPSLERAVQCMPRHIGSYHLLAWSLLLQGKHAQARALFERAMALNRNFAENHGSLAVLDALAGDREKARAGIERATRLDRHSLTARLATLLLDRKPQDDPQRLHQQLVEELERLYRTPAFAGLVGIPPSVH